MITDKNIYLVCSIVLVVGSVVTFCLSLGFLNPDIFTAWWLFALFIFAVSFVMELFRVNITDLIYWLLNRFNSRVK